MYKTLILIIIITLATINLEKPILAEEKTPADQEKVLNIVYSDIVNEKYDQALKTMEEKNLVNSTDKKANLYLAIIYHKKCILDKALVQYFKVLQNDNNNIAVNYNLALLFQDMGNKEKALEIYEKILKLDPKFDRAYFNAATVYYDLNNFEKAKDYYEKYLSKNPQDFETINNLGVIYKNEKNFDKAKEYFNKSLQLNSNYPASHYNLALIYLLSENKKEFDKELEILKKLSPEHVKIIESQIKKS